MNDTQRDKWDRMYFEWILESIIVRGHTTVWIANQLNQANDDKVTPDKIAEDLEEALEWAKRQKNVRH